jgi:hypothetical protein
MLFLPTLLYNVGRSVDINLALSNLDTALRFRAIWDGSHERTKEM